MQRVYQSRVKLHLGLVMGLEYFKLEYFNVSSYGEVILQSVLTNKHQMRINFLNVSISKCKLNNVLTID